MKFNYDINTTNPNCVDGIVPLSVQILIQESARGRVPSYSVSLLSIQVTAVWVGLGGSKLVRKEVG